MEIVFGPVPSRRLGHSLGINNIPPKMCSYSCIYCQVGRTTVKTIELRHIYRPAQIAEQVKTRLQQALNNNLPIDYATFVADGEPTLDVELGSAINKVKKQGISVAVISNGSLVWRQDVKHSLYNADWVSLKVDAVSYDIWRRINKPHKMLNIEEILNGMIEFSKNYKGILATETMLVKNINDGEEEIKRIADFITILNTSKAYIAIPIRPPATNVSPANEQSTNTAFQIFEQRLGKTVEYLIGYEGSDFAYTGNIREDVLSITAVHPMRKEAVRELLEKANAGWNTIQDMLDSREIVELQYQGNTFYMRKLPGYLL